MLTAEQRIEKAHTEIMRHKGFVAYTSLIMVGESKIDDNEQTARTNGRDIWYGRKFVESLNDSELRGLILHEAKHKMYRHMETWQHLAKINRMKTNMACDYVINLEIQDEGNHNHDNQGKPFCTLPKGGLIDERFRGLSTADVFNMLPDFEMGGGGAFKPLDDHDWENAQGMTEQEKNELAKEIDQAIRQGMVAHAKQNGKGMSDMAREFGDLTEPEVDWREQLREFVTATCSAKDASSWRRVNRRYIGNDIYMPSLIGERVGHLVIGVDTSGSIGGNELNDFMSEVKAVAETVHPDKVDLIYWGSSVVQHEEYQAGDLDGLIQSTNPKGGGGTAPDCLAEYLKEKNIKPEATIILTDGFVPNWGFGWESPTLWVVANNKSATADNGKTIHIK